MQDNLPLRDIHLPDPVSWWPPAIGWWLMLFFLLLLIIALVFAVRQWRKPRLRKSARDALDAVFLDYRQHRDALQLLQALSITLRRIGISYLDRNEVGGLLGHDWFHRLNELSDKAISEDSIQLLSEAPYRSSVDADAEQINLLTRQLQAWAGGLPMYVQARGGSRHV